VKNKIPPSTIQIDFKRSELPLDASELSKIVGIENPKIYVEIGFGNGEFLVEMAKRESSSIFIGFEISGISVEKLRSRVKRENLRNVFCIREDGFWGLYFCFPDSSIDKIFINFPDPWPKRRHEKRRITERKKLILFFRKLKPEGKIEILTDSENFVNYTVEQAMGIFKVKAEEKKDFSITTKYMRKWLQEGRKIYSILLEKDKSTFLAENKKYYDFEIEKLSKPKMFLERKIEKFPYRKEELEHKVFKIQEGVFVKFFDIFEKENKILIETLISEYGYEQMFIIKIEKRGENFILDISPFSSVIRTEGIEKLIEKLSEGTLSK
jgi:tRNA (guanine-N7-)-methyltransferase